MAPCNAGPVGVDVFGVVCWLSDCVIWAPTPGSGAISMVGSEYTAGSHESPMLMLIPPNRDAAVVALGCPKYCKPTSMPDVACPTNELMALVTPIHLAPTMDPE